MSVRRCRVPSLVTFKVGAQLSALFFVCCVEVGGRASAEKKLKRVRF